MKSAKLLVALLVLACGALLTADEADAVDTFTYQFTDSGQRPFESWGGLLGSMGSYDLVGTLDLNIDNENDTAWFSNVQLTLVGEAGPQLQLNGQSLPLYHDLTSLVGTVVDPNDPDENTLIHFEQAPGTPSCDLLFCTLASFEDSKFTDVDAFQSPDNTELRLSATSGVQFWFDTPSYQLTDAVGELVVIGNASSARGAPEPGSLVLVGMFATVALSAGRVCRHRC